MVNFEPKLSEIDSNYPLVTLEDSLSFPTVCGMLMDIFLQKNGNREIVPKKQVGTIRFCW